MSIPDSGELGELANDCLVGKIGISKLRLGPKGNFNRKPLTIIFENT